MWYVPPSHIPVLYIQIMNFSYHNTWFCTHLICTVYGVGYTPIYNINGRGGAKGTPQCEALASATLGHLEDRYPTYQPVATQKLFGCCTIFLYYFLSFLWLLTSVSFISADFVAARYSVVIYYGCVITMQKSTEIHAWFFFPLLRWQHSG